MLGEKVKQWLVEEGIFKKDVPDKKAEWHYLVEFPAGSNQMTDIVKPENKDVILVLSGIALSERHYRALHSLTSDKKRNLIHRWKMDLLFRKAEFRMHPESGDLQRIDFSVPIYTDEIKKSVLMEALREVFRCKIYIIWNLKHEFGRTSDIDAMFH
ncbi:MAG TPA: DUF2299 domain-containing protein [Archaeoglobaceae archaeon]|nr:DUF2299 domain-containing protein [Archaeoglobaceae archaeon]